MIDHCEDDPVKVYINYSSICSWYDGGKQMGLEPVPTLGMRRYDTVHPLYGGKITNKTYLAMTRDCTYILMMVIHM